ncbi:MAG: hypothetical protein HON94_03470 [Methylococcales bacterium]|nr:hypothetical protein [Methylococcales bacterium]
MKKIILFFISLIFVNNLTYARSTEKTCQSSSKNKSQEIRWYCKLDAISPMSIDINNFLMNDKKVQRLILNTSAPSRSIVLPWKRKKPVKNPKIKVVKYFKPKKTAPAPFEIKRYQKKSTSSKNIKTKTPIKTKSPKIKITQLNKGSQRTKTNKKITPQKVIPQPKNEVIVSKVLSLPAKPKSKPKSNKKLMEKKLIQPNKTTIKKQTVKSPNKQSIQQKSTLEKTKPATIVVKKIKVEPKTTPIIKKQNPPIVSKPLLLPKKRLTTNQPKEKQIKKTSIAKKHPLYLSKCKLRQQIIQCDHNRHFKLVKNSSASAISSQNLAKSNKMNINFSKLKQYNDFHEFNLREILSSILSDEDKLTIKNYYHQAYTTYLNKMLSIGLAEVTISWRVFKKGRLGYLSRKHESTFSYLKSERKKLPNITHRLYRELGINDCKIFSHTIITCAIRKNFVFRATRHQ